MSDHFLNEINAAAVRAAQDVLYAGGSLELAIRFAVASAQQGVQARKPESDIDEQNRDVINALYCMGGLRTMEPAT